MRFASIVWFLARPVVSDTITALIITKASGVVLVENNRRQKFNLILIYLIKHVANSVCIHLLYFIDGL
jgi:hypothetical protein